MNQAAKRQSIGHNINTKIDNNNLWCSHRLFVSILACIGCACNYALRVNLSVAIVCMVNHTALGEAPRTGKLGSESGYCKKADNESSMTPEIQHDGPFAWPKELQGTLLSALFYGFILVPIPGALIAHRFGGKFVIGITMLIAASTTLLFPVSANYSVVVLVILRVIIGMGLGTHFPGFHKVLSSWVPPLERSVLFGIAFSGSQLGNVITLSAAGILCSTYGWESVFYITGGISVLWSIVWLCIVQETPERSRFASEDEKDHIHRSLFGQLDNTKAERRIQDLPWSRFIRSTPIYAIFITHFAANTGNFVMLTNLPTFIHDVLHFNIKSNGLFSALPYVAQFLMIILSGYVCDLLRHRNCLSTTNVRKLMVILSLCGLAVGLVSASYIPCSQKYLTVVVIVVAMGLAGCQNSGFLVNPADVAPQYAGIINSISNVFATIPGIAAPTIVAVITKQGTQSEWQTVFWGTAAILLMGTILYCIFGQATVQPWANELSLINEGTSDQEELAESKRRNSSYSVSYSALP